MNLMQYALMVFVIFGIKKLASLLCKSPSDAKYLVKRENEASYFYWTNKFHVVFFQKYSFLIECR